MCRQLTTIVRNAYKQSVMICEHDTIHLLNAYTTILMTREALYQLDDMFKSRCLMGKGSYLRFRQNDDGYIELWIGRGAFYLSPVELFEMAKLIEEASEILRTTPLEDLLPPPPEPPAMRTPIKLNHSLN